MTPRFKDVPEHWRTPMGPYRQAPVEFGGEWWLVSPFTGEEPWRNQGGVAGERRLPPGFVEIFGERPRIAHFRSASNPSSAFRAALVKWEQDLRFFKQVGIPEWADAASVAAAERIYRAWGMGAPLFYEGRYGWLARFVESGSPDYQTAAFTAIETPHLIVARYQIRLLEAGERPPVQHPFVPPALWPDSEA